MRDRFIFDVLTIWIEAGGDLGTCDGEQGPYGPLLRYVHAAIDPCWPTRPRPQAHPRNGEEAAKSSGAKQALNFPFLQRLANSFHYPSQTS